MPVPELLTDGPAEADRTIVLAHGAGAGMESDFMTFFAEHLAGAGLRVVRFEFPYMEQRRETGRKSPPNREPVLKETWLAVIQQLGAENLVIGGKSMGGRIASLIADEAGVAGLVCLGYPFHPVGKPDRLRVEHLRELSTPTLILQGERDTFGNREDVSGYELSQQIRVEWLPDGDHSFKPRKKSGATQEENWTAACASIETFVRER
ncbi:alpha/beta fold hydrolase [Maioricimonas sp. JC845]|uniref:alpha/beta fold hydrolase n=1 Tax=Maioricimonas sp. JC845 TaxID=3232138 RepID=UPI00345B31A1